jgi:hypothetical protein
VLDLLDAETRRSLVLDDEALDLVVGEVACPDDRNVAPRRVADPPLLSIENPGVAFAFGGRGHSSAGSRTHQGLGETKAADLFPSRHRGQPLLFLLLRSVEIDRAHRQAAVHTPERTERSVDACYFHRDKAEQLLAPASAAIAFIAQPSDLQFLEGRQQLERKRIFGPIFVDDRLDLALHVCPHLLDDRLFVDGQDIRELVEVAVRRRQRFNLLHFLDCDRHLALLSINLHQLVRLSRRSCQLTRADVAKHPRDFE